ncbi:MAG TPA: S8 family serine peptidase [Anaerolineales bacterium]|nr:S8 family serine peptidase [Anaerolineales bacterium]
MFKKTLVITFLLALIFGAFSVAVRPSAAAGPQTYLVVFDGTQNADGTFSMTATLAQALTLLQSAGGTVKADLSGQIGVFIVQSENALFATIVQGSGLVEVVGRDYGWKAFQTLDEALQAGAVVDLDSADGLEGLQWSMDQINAPAAHALQTGVRAVDVGILDTGIEGTHIEFDDDGVPGGSTNVDCARGRDFVAFGPGIGSPDPCIDNGFHGTHVAGIVAAQDNGIGITGVAPNVTLVPVKVCDTAGYCYASAVVAGITYAGDIRLDVINMSFFVDDDELLASTEFKCSNDPTQRAFRRSVERALGYARQRGVAPVAALGNSDVDLANPPEGNDCEVIPAESAGVIGTMSLGPLLQKARYSNYGFGPTDVAAPGGSGTTGDCTTTVLSAFPGNSYGCIQGTSMASPHVAGVAALIVSQFGVLRPDGDVKLSPGTVQSNLQSTAVDLGLVGYDMCFGHGRVDALRAVLHDTSSLSQANPFCPEYSE